MSLCWHALRVAQSEHFLRLKVSTVHAVDRYNYDKFIVGCWGALITKEERSIMFEILTDLASGACYMLV